MGSNLTIYCDGGSRGNPGPAAWAFVVERDGTVVAKSSGGLGVSTNNVAEYSAVDKALSWLADKAPDGVEKVSVILDSELVASQLGGKFKVKSEHLRGIFYSIKEKEKKISPEIFYLHVPREKNRLADSLVNLELDKKSERNSEEF